MGHLRHVPTTRTLKRHIMTLDATTDTLRKLLVLKFFAFKLAQKNATMLKIYQLFVV